MKHIFTTILTLFIFSLSFADTTYCNKIEDERIIEDEGYITVSWNKKTFTPNYVGETLTKDNIPVLCNTKLSYYTEMRLMPKERVYSNEVDSLTTALYASKYNWSQTYEAFYPVHSMVNVTPMAARLIPLWEETSALIKSQLTMCDVIYVVSGPIFDQFRISKTMKVAAGEMKIPAQFFKAAIGYTNEGVLMFSCGWVFENDNTKQDIVKTQCSINMIEALTELDFFPSVSNDDENHILHYVIEYKP